jgi:MFS family permease
MEKNWRTPIIVLLAGALIVNFSMGIRHGMGLFLKPMTGDLGFTREAYGFAMAMQNLMWGLSSPVLGMLADKYGAARVIALTCVLYAVGLWGMEAATTPLMLALTGGVIIGMAQGGCTVGVISGVVGRSVDASQRQQALSIAGALGAAGQFYLTPVLQWVIGEYGWRSSLIVAAGMMLIVVPVSMAMTEPGKVVQTAGPQQSVGAAIREAWGERSFKLLCMGYFVCGLQLAFVGVHMPAYLRDKGLSANVGVAALALIAVGNIVGTYWWGMQGAKRPKRYLLSAIYALRAVAILLFLAVPLSPWSVYVFALCMGALWLATVPLTNGLVAQIFGVKYMSMLAGMVFLGHQIGSFLGAWMGGVLFDATGSYTIAWLTAAGFGFLAAVVHLPINESPLARLSAQPVPA